MSDLIKNETDVSRVFLAYLALQGDINRTALAVQMEPEDVAALSEQERWAEKVRQFAALKEDDENVQVQMNRALNFVQARQLASLVDSVIKDLSKDDVALKNALQRPTKNGCIFDSKPLTDLVKAAQMIQDMTSKALGDDGGKVDDKNSDRDNSNSAFLNVARSLNAIAANRGLDAVAVVRKSLNPDSDDPEKFPRVPEKGTD